jgi:SAM-dependent methyltransferase
MQSHPIALALLLATATIGTVSAAPGHDVHRSEHHGGAPGHAANEHMNARSFEQLVASFESPERMAWQRPDALLDQLGPLDGRTVADIGSGTGFLAFRMAERGARVLCVDVDERFLAYILGKRDALGLAERIELRPSPYERPALAAEEVDLVITVNTYHHIEDRPAYFRHVRRALRPGGRLVVVDFDEGEQPVGPGPSMKIAPARIEAELREAGFEAFSIDRELLPYQFVLSASP